MAMGTPTTRSLFFLMLCVPMALAMASPAEKLVYPCPCDQCPQENETRLHMYLHQFPAWPNVSNANEILAIDFTSHLPFVFGTMYVHDWFLTIGPNPNENIVARAQGFHIQAGQTAVSWYISQMIVFQDSSSFPGSTLEVSGGSGQWSIMGGTGTFTNAHGNIKFKDVPSTVSSITDIVKELDIHIFYTPETSTAVHGAAAN